MIKDIPGIAGFVFIFCIAGSLDFFYGISRSANIYLFIGCLLLLPKIICVIASVKNTVYNDEEDDL